MLLKHHWCQAEGDENKIGSFRRFSVGNRIIGIYGYFVSSLFKPTNLVAVYLGIAVLSITFIIDQISSRLGVLLRAIGTN